MSKKGFVLMETIVVIVVISVALLTIFTSYNKILSKIKSENKYDNSEYIYMTNYIKKYIKDKNCASSSEIFNMSSTSETPVNFYDKSSCSFATQDNFNIKKIHIITMGNGDIDTNLKKFDANLIDYIRKLDINQNDSVIMVEYQKDALDDKGNLKKDSNGTQLKETYIASLEWE